MAMRRGAKQDKAPITGVFDLNLVKRMFGSWRWWVLVATYIFYGNACQSYNYFAIYLRFNDYSVEQRNIIPACANICTMVTEFIYSVIADSTGNRVLCMIIPILCTTVVGSSILTAWPDEDAVRVVAFFLIACGFVTGIMWVSKHKRRSPAVSFDSHLLTGDFRLGPTRSIKATPRSER